MKTEHFIFFKNPRLYLILLFIMGFTTAQTFGQSEIDLKNIAQKTVDIDPFKSISIPEIDFVDGVPIFPWAKPVVILTGSDYQMGYQYSKQLSQIFGSWILRLIEQKFTPGQNKALNGYHWYIKKYAPEMINFFKGMADGAQQVGVKLTYEQVVAQFCLGVDNNGEYITPASGQAGFPPGAEDIRQSFSQQENKERCGSVAAWATATKDGKVITSELMTQY